MGPYIDLALFCPILTLLWIMLTAQYSIHLTKLVEFFLVIRALDGTKEVKVMLDSWSSLLMIVQDYFLILQLNWHHQFQQGVNLLSKLTLTYGELSDCYALGLSDYDSSRYNYMFTRAFVNKFTFYFSWEHNSFDYLMY